MSDPANMLSDPYRVRTGDTLTGIAKRSGRTLAELKRFNNLADANRLKVGQTLYLSEATAFGISVLFLDSLRHPIANLPYRLHFDGRTLQGLTDETGAILNRKRQAIAALKQEIAALKQEISEANERDFADVEQTLDLSNRFGRATGDERDRLAQQLARRAVELLAERYNFAVGLRNIILNIYRHESFG